MQGYVDAARVFERESGTAPGVDLDQASAAACACSCRDVCHLTAAPRN